MDKMMYLITSFIILTLFILYLIIKLVPLINIHNQPNREKMSPFECGFDPFSNSRISFSIHFFSIGLMFLIFDIEISLILPIPLIKNQIMNNYWMLFSFTMIIILMMGLILEWKEGSMNWK